MNNILKKGALAAAFGGVVYFGGFIASYQFLKPLSCPDDPTNHKQTLSHAFQQDKLKALICAKNSYHETMLSIPKHLADRLDF